MRAKRSNVWRIKLFPVPNTSKNCLGCERRLIGQKRLPIPPAMMMQ